MFVSVDVTDSAVMEGILRMKKEANIGGGTDTGKLHYTLMFLGEVEKSEAGLVADALTGVEFDAFALRCRGVGTFRGRIVWIGTDKDGGRMLGSLASKIAAALEPFGFAREGKFTPHATVFRVKNRDGDTASVLKRFGNEEFGVQRVDAFRLKSSTVLGSRTVYDDVRVVGARR